MEQCQFCGKPHKAGQKFCKHCGGTLNPNSKTIANLDILQKKIEQDSLNPQHYLSLGNLYFENNSITCALEQFHKASALEENSTEIHFKIGRAQNLLENHNEALDSLQKARELDKTNNEVVRELILTYFSTQNWNKAIEHSQKFLKDNEDQEILLVLARSYKKNDQLDEALKVFESVSSKDDVSTQVLEELAGLYETKESYKDLVKIRERLWEANKDEQYLLELAKAHLFIGDTQKATDLIVNSESPTKKDFADFLLAIGFLIENNLEKADQLFSTIKLGKLDLEDKDKKFGLEVILKIGDSKLQENSLEDAISWYQYAKEIDPKNDSIIKKLAETNFLTGQQYRDTDINKSKLFLREAFELQHSEAGERLAEVNAAEGAEFLKQKEFKAALNSFRQAVKYDQRNPDYKEKATVAQDALSRQRRKRSRVFLTTTTVVSVLAIISFLFWKFTTGTVTFSVISNQVVGFEPPKDSEIQLFIDGQPKGTVTENKKTRLSKGEYEVKAVHSQYHDFTQKFKVEGNKDNTVVLSLQPKYAIIEIKSQPSGATIFLNEKQIGKTPMTTDSLMLGTYAIKLEKNDFFDSSQKIELSEVGQHSVSTELISRVLLFDDFKDNRNSWEIDNENSIVNGEYRIFDSKNAYQNAAYTKRQFSDFKLETVVRKVRGRNNYATAGLQLRLQKIEPPWHDYWLEIAGNGYYRLGVSTSDKGQRFLTSGYNNWQKTKLLKHGTLKNKITVICKGSRISLFFNDKLERHFNDTHLRKGYVGLLGAKGADVRFDYIKITTLKSVPDEVITRK